MDSNFYQSFAKRQFLQYKRSLLYFLSCRADTKVVEDKVNFSEEVEMIVFQISFNQRGVDKYYFRGKFALQKGKCSVRCPGLNTLNGVLINILQVDKYRLAKKKNDFSTFVMSFFKRNKMFSERKKGYLSKSEKALEITIKPLLSAFKIVRQSRSSSLFDDNNIFKFVSC